MFRLVILIAIFSTCLAFPKIRPFLDGRIIGGEATTIEEHPFQVSLQYHGSHGCGGSIIGPKHVVTAAHCTIGSPPESFTVRAGTTIRESGGVVIDVIAIHQHPDYMNYDNDISVLELASELPFGKTIQPIDLESVDPIAGTSAVCTGWGVIRDGGIFLPFTLQEVTLQIIDRDDCQDAYYETITKRMICAGINGGGKDACQGDSGGPLVIKDKLVGIVSWGYGCATPDYPGVHANVAELRDFIMESIK